MAFEIPSTDQKATEMVCHIIEQICDTRHLLHGLKSTTTCELCVTKLKKVTLLLGNTNRELNKIYPVD